MKIFINHEAREIMIDSSFDWMKSEAARAASVKPKCYGPTTMMYYLNWHDCSLIQHRHYNKLIQFIS